MDEAQGGAPHLEEGGGGEKASPSDAVIPQVHLVVHRDASLEAHRGGGGACRCRLQQGVAGRREPDPLASPQRRSPAMRHGGGAGGGWRRHHDVGVGALECKGAHAALRGAGRDGEGGSTRGGGGDVLPGERHGVHRPRQSLAREAGEVRVDRVEVHDGSRTESPGPNHSVKQPHSAGGGLGVSHARLHRREGEGSEARRRLGAGLHQHRVGGAHLDGIAEGGPGAVHLEAVNGAGIRAAGAQGAANGALLGGAVGGGEGAGSAILVDRRRHQGPRVERGSRVARQCAELESHARLAAHVAVGTGVQGLAAAILGEHARLGEHLGRERAEGDVDAARRDRVRLARHDAGDGDVGPHQRRRARGVDGEADALEAERVRYAPARDAGGAARRGVRTHHICHPAVLVAGDADGDPRSVGGDVASHPRLGLPGCLEEHALLRIQEHTLGGGHVEELGVEHLDIRGEAAEASLLDVRVVECVEAPPRQRHAGDGVDRPNRSQRVAGGVAGRSHHPEHLALGGTATAGDDGLCSGDANLIGLRHMSDSRCCSLNHRSLKVFTVNETRQVLQRVIVERDARRKTHPEFALKSRR